MPSRHKGGDAVNGKSRILILLACVFMLTLSLAPASLASPLSAKKARLQEVQARLQNVYQQVDIAVENYNQANESLTTVKGKIKENGSQLKVAEYNLSIAERHLNQRAQDIYKTHDVSLLDVFFSSNSFDDLVTQLDVMERLSTNDAETVDAVAAIRSDIAQRRVQLKKDQTEATALVKKRAETKTKIVGLQQQLESTSAGLKSDIRRIEAAQAAAARRAAEAARRAAAAQRVASSGSGGDTSSSSSSGGDGNPSSVPAPGGSGRAAVVGIARQYLGVRYVYGGASPSGFDCSGLAMFCYARAGIGIPRTATAQQKAMTPVPIGALQPGDLVFFGSSGYSYHVGIFAGGGSMIHAPHTGDVVRYGSISGAWIGGRR